MKLGERLQMAGQRIHNCRCVCHPNCCCAGEATLRRSQRFKRVAIMGSVMTPRTQQEPSPRRIAIPILPFSWATWPMCEQSHSLLGFLEDFSIYLGIPPSCLCAHAINLRRQVSGGNRGTAGLRSAGTLAKRSESRGYMGFHRVASDAARPKRGASPDHRHKPSTFRAFTKFWLNLMHCGGGGN